MCVRDSRRQPPGLQSLALPMQGQTFTFRNGTNASKAMHQWHADGGYMNLHVHQHVGNIVHFHVHHHVPRHSTSACSSATISPNSLTTSAIPWETSIAYTSKTWSKLSPKIWGGKCPGGKCSKIKNLCLDTF